MPLLNFTKLTHKVRNHSKRQTIRKPRKRPLKVGDTLHVYVKVKLGTATIKSIETKMLGELTNEEAIKDGFRDLKECHSVLQQMHNCYPNEIFDIITFEPNWKATIIVKIPKLLKDVFDDRKISDKNDNMDSKE